MKMIIRVIVIGILIYSAYLTTKIIADVGMGSNTDSFRFLIAIGVAVIGAFIGFGYSEEYPAASILFGIILPFFCLNYASKWNEYLRSRQQSDLEARVRANCTKIMDSGSKNGYGYYYLCKNGQIVYDVK